MTCDLRDGIYQVTHGGICAGLAVRNGRVIIAAPILWKRMRFWLKVARPVRLA